MDAYFYIILGVGLLSTIICVVAGILKKTPNDVTILSVAAVELALLVYLVGSIVRVIAGERIAGEAWEFWGYLVTALLLAGFVSFYASASPDGLEKVAADKGIDRNVEEHAAADSPLADYGIKGIEAPRLSGGLAGVIGVGGTLAVGSGAFWAVKRRRASHAPTGAQV